jgi:hypothetical protein
VVIALPLLACWSIGDQICRCHTANQLRIHSVDIDGLILTAQQVESTGEWGLLTPSSTAWVTTPPNLNEQLNIMLAGHEALQNTSHCLLIDCSNHSLLGLRTTASDAWDDIHLHHFIRLPGDQTGIPSTNPLTHYLCVTTSADMQLCDTCGQML